MQTPTRLPVSSRANRTRGLLRQTLLIALIGVIAGVPSARAAESPASTTSATTTPAPVVKGSPLEAPRPTAKPRRNASSGGTAADENKKHAAKPSRPSPPSAGATVAPSPAQSLSIPMIPSSSCATMGVPPVLVPIYQRAAAAYGLGPQGPAVLAAINEVETGFGTNLGPSSAGAEGWMQFMPSTWAIYGVSASGQGAPNPNNPEDAIFTAARYLQAAGMPQNTYGAIFAYNHAGWYVAEVLANAACYAPAVGSPSLGATSPAPQLQVLSCSAAPAWHREIPAEYMRAFESAAARYGLGQRGVWALAAVARLESNFGRGMDKRELDRAGPLGLEPWEWRHYAVDGEGDGPISHSESGRLGGHPGARDLVPRQPARRPLRPQPGRVVRAGSPERSRPHAGPLQGHLYRLEGSSARRQPGNEWPDGDPGQRHRFRPEGSPAGSQGRDRRRQLDFDDPIYMGRWPSVLLLSGL